MRVILIHSKMILYFFVFLEFFAMSVLTDNVTNQDENVTIDSDENVTINPDENVTIDDSDIESSKQEAFGFPGGWRPPRNRILKRNCQEFTSCSQCINYPCTWNLEYVGCFTCTTKRDNTCKTWPKNTTAITSENKNVIKCPSIVNEQKTFYIPSGMNKTISVKIDLSGSKDVMTLFNYRCEFKIEEKTAQVKAKFLGSDTIYCDPFKFSYETNKPKVQASLKILAGENGYYLENPDNVGIEIFKCNKMSKNCKTCASIDGKYNCGWCETKNTCENTDNCEHAITREAYCK